jgi:hypothetical protein
VAFLAAISAVPPNSRLLHFCNHEAGADAENVQAMDLGYGRMEQIDRKPAEMLLNKDTKGKREGDS